MNPSNQNGEAGEEGRLIESVVRRFDESAFRTLYRRHTDQMYSQALRMVGGRHSDAEDVVQEAWRRALTKLGEFRFEAPLGRWLRGFIVRCALEHQRDHWREVWSGSAAEPAAPTERLHPTGLVDLQRAFEGLPTGYRTVLVLHDVEGYTHAEIAGMLSIAEGTSKSQLVRARAWMRRAMGEEER